MNQLSVDFWMADQQQLVKLHKPALEYEVNLVQECFGYITNYFEPGLMWKDSCLADNLGSEIHIVNRFQKQTFWLWDVNQRYPVASHSPDSSFRTNSTYLWDREIIFDQQAIPKFLACLCWKLMAPAIFKTPIDYYF